MPITRHEIDAAAEGLEELLVAPGIQMMWHDRLQKAITALHRAGRLAATIPVAVPPSAPPNVVPATVEEATIEAPKTKRTYKKREAKAPPAKTVKKGKSWRY